MSLSNPRRVMYLLDSYAHPYAGTEGQLQKLIQRIDRDRYEPSVAVLRPSQYLEQKRFPCPVSVLHIYKNTRPTTLLKLARYARDLRRRDFDIVHIFLNDASIIAPFFLKLSGLKVVVSRRDMGFWYNPTNLKLLRFNRHFVDRVVCNSSAVKQCVHRMEHYPLEKLEVIYNGYDPEDFPLEEKPVSLADLGVPAAARIIGLVANVRRVKRIEDGIRALSLVAQRISDAHLLVVGSESGEEGAILRRELEALAQRLGVAERIHFLGAVARLNPIIRIFSVGLLCSESEGFANAIIEYMKCGVPTVCTDTGGNPEIVQHGFNGFLVPVGDAAAMAEHVIQLLTDGELAKRLGNGAEATAEQYPLKNMVVAHLRLYDQVLRDTS